jgi:hypothetical protein
MNVIQELVALNDAIHVTNLLIYEAITQKCWQTMLEVAPSVKLTDALADAGYKVTEVDEDEQSNFLISWDDAEELVVPQQTDTSKNLLIPGHTAHRLTIQAEISSVLPQVYWAIANGMTEIVVERLSRPSIRVLTSPTFTPGIKFSVGRIYGELYSDRANITWIIGK